MVLHPHSITEDGSARDGTAGIDGQHRDFLAEAPIGGDQTVDQRALPCTGIAGDPDDHCMARCFPEQAEGRDPIMVPIFHQRDEPRDGPDVAGPG